MQNDPARRDTIARLMDEHGDALLRLCALYMRDAQLAEDAVQETFVKAWNSLAAFRGECCEKTWLTKIAVNVCRDMLRTPWLRRIDRSVDITLLPETSHTDASFDNTVLTEVMRLPEKLRAVILLRYYQEMTLTQTADTLNISLSAVRQRQHKANRILRERLKEWYFDE